MLKNQIGLLSEFNAHGVEYLIIGGYAVNAHGVPRTTRDLDILIRPTEENAAAAFRALKNLGAPLTGLEPNDLLNDEAHFQMGREPNRIDVLSSVNGIAFDQAWRNRIEAEVRSGLQVPFLCKEDLIQNKLETGRSQDLADVEKLRKTEFALVHAADIASQVDWRYRPLVDALPNHVSDFEWKQERGGGVQSYQHKDTGGWLHIHPGRLFFDGSGKPRSATEALNDALQP